MKVDNLTSPRSGNVVDNQFTIRDGDTEVFQSYNTTIAKKQGVKYTISGDYNYSTTTNRYFGKWLRGFGWYDSDIKELKKFLTKASEGDTLELNGCTFEYINEL